MIESEASYEIEFLEFSQSCWLKSSGVTLNLVVTLQQHSDPSSLNSLQLSRWMPFVNDVMIHEQKQVDIHLERIEVFRGRVENLPESFNNCAALEVHVLSLWEGERLLDEQQQAAFHTSDDLRSRGLRAPFQLWIDNNEAKLTGYQRELELI